MAIPPVEQIWMEINSILPSYEPSSFPFYCGEVQGYQIYIVDGYEIMIKYDMDFHAANNWLEESEFIPNKQIWIDNLYVVEDWPFNCLHEVYEVCLMDDEEWTYEKAHEAANKVEREYRKKHREQLNSIEQAISNLEVKITNA